MILGHLIFSVALCLLLLISPIVVPIAVQRFASTRHLYLNFVNQPAQTFKYWRQDDLKIQGTQLVQETWGFGGHREVQVLAKYALT